MAANQDVKPFVISRTMNAPRALVWKAFTEPERLQQWHSPKGFKGRTAKMDFRPGGMYLYCLTSPDGNEMWGKALYREMTPPDRLVYVNCFSDAQGGTTTHPLSPTWPKEMLTTIDFVEQAGKTTITITWIPIHAGQDEINTFEAGRDGMKQGWTGSLDQLEAHLASPEARP